MARPSAAVVGLSPSRPRGEMLQKCKGGVAVVGAGEAPDCHVRPGRRRQVGRHAWWASGLCTASCAEAAPSLKTRSVHRLLSWFRAHLSPRVRRILSAASLLVRGRTFWTEVTCQERRAIRTDALESARADSAAPSAMISGDIRLSRAEMNPDTSNPSDKQKNLLPSRSQRAAEHDVPTPRLRRREHLFMRHSPRRRPSVGLDSHAHRVLSDEDCPGELHLCRHQICQKPVVSIAWKVQRGMAAWSASREHPAR